MADCTQQIASSATAWTQWVLRDNYGSMCRNINNQFARIHLTAESLGSAPDLCECQIVTYCYYTRMNFALYTVTVLGCYFYVLWSACLSVCLSVCLFVCSNSTKFFTRYLWPCMAWSFYDGNAICYVFPVLKMTSFFHVIYSEWAESETTRMFRRVRQVAPPGAKSAVSDFCV